jgi:hypothetical protein
MTHSTPPRPVVRLEIAALGDADVTEVLALLDELGLAGEQLSRHVGIVDELAGLLVFSGDSLQTVFDAILTAAGGAAAAKFGALLGRLPNRSIESTAGKTVSGRLIYWRAEQIGFLIDVPALQDEEALKAMWAFDTAGAPTGMVLAWNAKQQRWLPM